jgi:hypothetical protein
MPTLWPTPDVITTNGVENDTDIMTGSNATSANGGRQSIKEAIDLLNAILVTVEEDATIYTDKNFSGGKSDVYSGQVSGGGIGSSMSTAFLSTKTGVGNYTVIHPSLPGMTTVVSTRPSGSGVYIASVDSITDSTFTVLVREGLTPIDFAFTFVSVKNST